MFFHSNIDMATRCGQMLAASRYHSGLSRKAMGAAMGTSESTIKAWEEGQGSPSLFGMLKWYRITGDCYYRAMLDFFWPEAFHGLVGGDSESKIKHALMTYLQEVAGPIELKKFHYLVFGNHGSAWSGVLDMACAYAHTSLSSRYRTLEIIQASYDISRGNEKVVKPPHIDVDMDHSLLKNAIQAAENAQRMGLNGYIIGDIFGKDDNIISSILLSARLDAGVSKKDLAKALGKTERTIQNWENGFNPSFLEVCSWFQAIGKSAWAYIQCAIYNHDVHYSDAYADKCRQELIQHFSAAEISEIRKACYIIFGKHGSNWNAMLEALFEYVCSPLAQRVISARSILVSYSVDAHHTELVATDNISPDIDNLRMCIELGTKAAKQGKTSYQCS